MNSSISANNILQNFPLTGVPSENKITNILINKVFLKIAKTKLLLRVGLFSDAASAKPKRICNHLEGIILK